MNNGTSKRPQDDDFGGSVLDKVETKLLNHHIHLLSGEIEQFNVDNCIKWILMENLNKTSVKPLTLYINSTGGDLYCAFALIDIMKQSYHPIRTIGIGAVMSAAFLIFASGARGERYASRNASFMCHQHTEQLEGKHHDLKAAMREGDSYNTKMINCLQEATGLLRSQVKSKLLPASDVYLSAEEVVQFNVADQVI
jgi:ATP-dependent Clp protease, protease subunit